MTGYIVCGRACCLIFAFLSVMQSSTALAELWQAQHKIVLGARYDTNLTLRADNALESKGRDFQWLGELSKKTETSVLSSQLQLLSAVRSGGNGIYDSDDQKGDIAYQKNWLNHGLSISLDYTRDSTLATEFQLASARIFNTRKRREKFFSSLKTYYDFTQRDKWVFNYSHGETQYRDSGIVLSALNDFRQSYYSSSWQRAISENFISQATVFQFETEVIDQINDSRTRGYQLGFKYVLSKLVTLDALLGYRTSTRQLGNGFAQVSELEGSGNVFELNSSYLLKNSSMDLGMSRTVDPDISDGSLLEKTKAEISYNRQWQPNLVTKLSYFFLRQEEDNREASRVDNEQYALNIYSGIGKNIGVGFSYQYIEKDFHGSDEYSKGNIYLLSIVYSDLLTSISR